MCWGFLALGGEGDQRLVGEPLWRNVCKALPLFPSTLTTYIASALYAKDFSANICLYNLRT